MTNTNNWLSFGRARSDEETLKRIAHLIHQTDPYIYPFWRSSADDFVNLIVPHMKEDGFIFNHRNIYVARQTGNECPLGILVALNHNTNLDFDYSTFDDESSKFVIEHYLQKVIRARQTLPEKTALIINLCVSPEVRGCGIGSRLFYDYIWRMRPNGTNAFQLDCLQENELAALMYQKMGFTITKNTEHGFDGTKNPKVKIYTMLYTF